VPVRVLIVEDESLIRWSLRQKFEQLSYNVDEAENGAQALDLLAGDPYDLIILDHRLPDTTGLEILRRLRRHDEDVVVIMMTAYSSIPDAVEAIKLGAHEYLAKPFQMDLLLITVRKAMEATKLRREVRELRQHLQHNYDYERVIGQDPKMLDVMGLIRKVADGGQTTVFLRGETGTGKDLLAGAIHYNSNRAPLPFINITCTAISESLLESELFGHERGAFTDAKVQKRGLLEQADGGTVFLDEVGDMAPGLQAKLLRFLEERTFRRVGGTDEISVDVRVIAATNRNIEQAVEAGAFRRDLMFRLNGFPIFIPPLRERGEDLRLLTDFFVRKFASEFKKETHQIDPAAHLKLRGYSWPGNVRELRNVCERAVLLSSEKVLQAGDFLLGQPDCEFLSDEIEKLELPENGLDFEAMEIQLLCQALERTAGNQTEAAKLLNLSRDTFRYRADKHSLT